jgi:hypothetical protein
MGIGDAELGMWNWGLWIVDLGLKIATLNTQLSHLHECERVTVRSHLCTDVQTSPTRQIGHL